MTTSVLGKLLSERQSTRAFHDRPVPKQLLKDIFSHAADAPSGGNLQGCRSYVLTGSAKQQLVDAVAAQIAAGKTEDQPHIAVYPEKLKSPYRERRFECGMALYKALGIGRDDKHKRNQQWQANYRFFDAPVGVLFAIDEQMGPAQYIDLGIYLQTLMLLAQEAGLNSCPQLSWSSWPDTCKQVLGVPETGHIVVGLALGYGDPSAAVNQYRTSRVELEESTVFSGF